MGNRNKSVEDILDELASHFSQQTLWTLARFLFGGVLSGVMLSCALAFIANSIKVTAGDKTLHTTFVAAYFYAAVFVPMCVLIYKKALIQRCLESRRLDLALAVLVGFALALSFHGTIARGVTKSLAHLTAIQLESIILLPALLLTIFVGAALTQMLSPPREVKTAAFFSDNEITSDDDDLLDIRPDAERFAERVLNGGSTESMVFGLDAPWGAGKSSFIRLCENIWDTRTAKKAIVYRFNPLQYEDRKHLLSKFVDGLITVIRENAFIPELQPTVSLYADLFKGERKVNLLGFEFTLSAPGISTESAHKQVSKVLADLPTRLIVIIDDLDRMEFAALKDVLFVVKKCFSFPNISFVLCYDTQNIAALESGSFDSEKISEFLEKFVNVKQGLFPTAEHLKNYLSKSRATAALHNPLSDPKLLDQAVGGLVQLYSSSEYISYLPLVGDVRKIKRLLNILVLLDLAQTDFELSDFDPLDLLHLLLVYINFPGLFRTIYNAETGGRNHFVSLVRQVDRSGSSNYANSEDYVAFVGGIEGRKTELLLLSKLFNVGRFTSPSTTNVSEIERRTLACFNESIDGRPGNLQRYLQLIVSVSKPPSGDSFRSLINIKKQVVAGMSLSSIYSDIAFHPSLGETRYEQLWRVITNSLEEFDAKGCASLIVVALLFLPHHAQLEVKDIGLGFRQTLIYFLLKLVDTGGWQDSAGLHVENTDENVLGIARWIYGEGGHQVGIIDTLMDIGRGALGLHDVLVFRLYCCADRGGSLFNLTRAVGLHSDPNLRMEGILADIVKPQMREMSQVIFRKFKERYIEPKINIFTLHGSLSPEELAGVFYAALQAASDRGEISRTTIEDVAARTANACLSFSVYQLANRLVSSGIGCGYYDEAGSEDQSGIHRAMNDYFFDVCFSDVEGNDGLRTFLDFALSQFQSEFGRRTQQYVPDVKELLKIFDAARLRAYWRSVRPKVVSHFTTIDRQVKTRAYTANYTQDVPALITVLDRFADS